MKKFLALLLSLVMVLALVACGDKKDDTNTDDQDNNEVTDFKVGFIMLHDENSTYDLNFINAAKEACETLGVEYTIVTNVPEGQECYDKAAELADAGCNIIFADSFGHEDYMIQAAKDFGCEAVLVGRGEAILQALKDQGIETLPKGVEIANADDVVDMHDDPATVVKKKKDSSMVVGLTMLKEGGGDAFVSAGSTGALLSAATLIVRRVKGIRRAAMGPQIPTKTGRECVLIDCGATADCTPEFLLQFAFMGSYYAEKVLGIENPRVALLNIGAEDSKGGELQKAVYPLLKQAGEAGKINFTGNIEARDVPLGGADVVVSDGFSGNILLKGIEGTALFMASMMKDMFKKNLLTKLAALLCMDGVKAFKKKMDYRETGGTALIGLSKPVIKAHGSSDALAIRNAIRQAIGAVEADVAATLAANMDHMVIPKEYQHAE